MKRTQLRDGSQSRASAGVAEDRSKAQKPKAAVGEIVPQGMGTGVLTGPPIKPVQAQSPAASTRIGPAIHATPVSPAKLKVSRILIVDDHPIVRAGLAELISKEPDLEVCGEASDASDALQKYQTLKPKLLLIDISLPSTNGIELVKQLRSLDKNILMLMLSLHDSGVYAERALRAGAKGYVNKQESWETIVGAIRSVLQGRVYLTREVSDRITLHRRATSNEDPLPSSVDSLSDRELEVFNMIGQGITTSEIAKKLFLSTKTIETHREKIKTKLRLRNACELMQHAVQWTFQEKQA